MILHWIEPKENGGCNILGYELFVNDGLGGDPIIKVDEEFIID